MVRVRVRQAADLAAPAAPACAAAPPGRQEASCPPSTAIIRVPDAPPAIRGESRLLEAFLAGRSPTTLRAYRRDLEDLANWMLGRLFTPDHRPDVEQAVARILSGGPGEANELALAWRADMRKRTLAPATINRRLAALRSLMKLARTLGLIGWAIEISGLRHVSYRDTRGPGAEGFQALLAVVRGRSPKAIRDRALLRLLYDLALRRAEAVALDISDVDLEAGRLWIVGKGHTERQALSLPEATADALRAWLTVRRSAAATATPTNGHSALFLSLDRAGKGSGRLTGEGVYKLVRHYGARAGLGRVRPHGLRHAAITEAVRAAQAAGMGIEEVLDYSRHADVATLMLYRDRDRNVQGQLAGLVAASAPTLRPACRRSGAGRPAPKGSAPRAPRRARRR